MRTDPVRTVRLRRRRSRVPGVYLVYGISSAAAGTQGRRAATTDRGHCRAPSGRGRVPRHGEIADDSQHPLLRAVVEVALESAAGGVAGCHDPRPRGTELDHIVPDVVHVLSKGRIVRTGGKELALELEAKGYAQYQDELV